MMKKKHIAIFAERLYGGGVEKILQIICHNFDYERYDLTLYSSRYEEMPKGTYPTSIRHQYYFDTFSNKKKSIFRFLNKVVNKIKLIVYYHCSSNLFYKLFIRNKYDVGIAFIEGYATRILSGGSDDMKKIAWVHTDMADNHWTNVAFRSIKEEKCVYQSLNKIVCVSNKVEDIVKMMFDISNTIVLHNPIDVCSIIQKSKLQKEQKEQKEQDIVRIVSLGALIYVKGYDRLLRVVARLKKDGKFIELIILGEGYMRQELEEYIQDNALQGYVKLPGFIDNPYPYLQSCDIYICSSYAEGFNTAISEALVLGRAIVTTDISGVHEQLGDKSEYGIIVKNSEEGLFNGISRMLENGNIRYYQYMASKRREIFNLNSQMQAIYNIIES